MKEERRETHRTMPMWASARWLNAMCGGERRFALLERKADTTLKPCCHILVRATRRSRVDRV